MFFILFILPGLHVGSLLLQRPGFSQVLELDPDLEYPDLQEKVATVPTGNPPFIRFLLKFTAPFDMLRPGQMSGIK